MVVHTFSLWFNHNGYGLRQSRTTVFGLLYLLLLFVGPTLSATGEINERENSEKRELPELLLELERQLREEHRPKFNRRFQDQDSDEIPEFQNEWVVRSAGGEKVVRELAREHSYEFIRQVRGVPDTYLLRHSDGQDGKKYKRGMYHMTKRLSDDHRVEWVEQQKVRRRTKRDIVDYSKVDRNIDLFFNDPYWPKQWALHDTRTMRDLPKLDLHVIGAWKKGYTGKGIVVTVLDDGVQRNHTDLMPNYDAEASFDLNDNDEDPMPAFNDYNRHGTRCAGEIAMVANNKKCGVGVAFNCKIGGIRMLDGQITDRLEAEALQFNLDHVDVYSASWGPNDDGKTVEGPGKLAEEALVKGITEGRGGKGAIYAWASGNGGSFGDDCDCDGYTDSIYTLSVSSASQSGSFPWYGEKCASTMATTYSSGAYSDQKIATTDLFNDCTTEHTGTSASAPFAAGIVALGLEANSELTWRDVQHITVWTSEPFPLIKNKGWHKNGVGFWANTRFGFGLMNADGFVTAAKDWKNVPAQTICTTTFPTFQEKKFSADRPGTVQFFTDSCLGQNNQVKYLEHLQIVVDIDYTRRGNLGIHLVSPAGTRTKLLSPRNRDNSKAGFLVWPFMSVHSWGEDPHGWWHLEISDEESASGSDHGAVKNISLIAYGTKEQPEHYKNGPRQYNMDYNKVHDERSTEEEEKRVKELQEKTRDLATTLVKRMANVNHETVSEDEANLHLFRINRALELIDQSLKTERVKRHEDPDPHVYSDTVSK